jgi:hypothetical protein
MERNTISNRGIEMTIQEAYEAQTKLYLLEPSDITSTGKLTGVSLRAYEIVLDEQKSKYSSYMDYTPKPTGKLFTFKNGKIVETKTCAKLNNKHINHTIVTTLGEYTPSWSASCFTDPVTAIAAKQMLQKDLINGYRRAAEKTLARLDALDKAIPSINNIVEENPELFL